MNGMDNCKMVKFSHKCFLSLLKKMLWKVTIAVVSMLLCIFLFNHDTKPSRKDFCLKYFIFVCNGMDSRNGIRIRIVYW